MPTGGERCESASPVDSLDIAGFDAVWQVGDAVTCFVDERGRDERATHARFDLLEPFGDGVLDALPVVLGCVEQESFVNLYSGWLVRAETG